MYDKVPTSMNFVEREKKVEKFWEENHIFEKSIDNRKKGDDLHLLRRTAYGQRKTTHRPCSRPVLSRI